MHERDCATELKEHTVTATYTCDGPELLAHRLAPYSGDQRMVFGASTDRELAQMLAGNTNGINIPIAWTPACARSRLADSGSF